MHKNVSTLQVAHRVPLIAYSSLFFEQLKWAYVEVSNHTSTEYMAFLNIVVEALILRMEVENER